MNETAVFNGRVLVVDDDAEIRDLVARSLDRHGFEVVTAADVPQAERALALRAFDLVILDVMMPGEDGLSFCRRFATREGPMVLILSALDGSGDRIAGLELGADCYLAKPCDPRELVATVRALLRRSSITTVDGPDNGRSAEFDGWQLDLAGRFLRDPDGVVIDLASAEFVLLRAFVERPRRVLSRDTLLDAAYGDSAEVFDRAIDVQVSRLRRKFGNQGMQLIRTVRNEGYMFWAVVVRR